MVLINVIEGDMDAVKNELELFEQKHIDEEDSVYSRPVIGRGLYDSSVSYYYMKEQSMYNLITERIMKNTMNGLVIFVFFVMNVMLVLIKILSEKELNQRRAQFLNCMGMSKKQRLKLIKKELLCHYYLLPAGLAVVFSSIFTVCTFHARMYTGSDISLFLEKIIPLWSGYLLVNTVLMWGIATVYAIRLEESCNGRNS